MKKTFLTLLAVFCLLAPHSNAKETITITDLAGRTVTLSTPVQHLILGEGRFLPTLGLFDQDDPAKRVVGMMGEFEKLDPAGYAQYIKHFPHINDIPKIGGNGEATFSAEKAFSVKPDVALFGMGSGHGPNDKSATVIAQLEAAGIPVIVLDFRVEPLENTQKSIEILGRILGQKDRATEFLTFYNTRLNLIETRLKDVTERPRVFIEAHAGMLPQCCRSFGRKMMGRFIEWAGGINAFGDLIPGAVAEVNQEQLLVTQPDIYIATAVGSQMTMDKTPNIIALGAGTQKEAALKTFENVLNRPGISRLDAVKNGHSYSIWHHFYNTPMNIAAVEVMAKWFHPDLFKDLDPDKTLKTYFDKFQAVPLDGVYWINQPHKGQM
jgi:iron complex transport system substrate-binding protein